MPGRFTPRPIRPVAVSDVNGWRLKRYEVTLDGRAVPSRVHSAVDATLAAEIPPPDDREPGVGFLIVNHGAEAPAPPTSNGD